MFKTGLNATLPAGAGELLWSILPAIGIVPVLIEAVKLQMESLELHRQRKRMLNESRRQGNEMARASRLAVLRIEKRAAQIGQRFILIRQFLVENNRNRLQLLELIDRACRSLRSVKSPAQRKQLQQVIEVSSKLFREKSVSAARMFNVLIDNRLSDMRQEALCLQP